MAGVGFGLRAIATDESFSSLLRAYGAASLISSGPWLISITTLLLVGVAGQHLLPDASEVSTFQASVTWMFCLSLLVSGPLQLTLTRFLADRSYEQRDDTHFGNLLGSMALMSWVAIALSLAMVPFFSDVDLVVRLLLGAGFCALCNVWLVVVALSSVRRHEVVVACFMLGYAVILLAAYALREYGLEGLLAAFALGQGALLFSALAVLAPEASLALPVRFEVLAASRRYWDLALVGLLFNAGVWVDKVLFWHDPILSHAVLGPLRASEVYDLPLFLAYLTSIPGMTVFLLRVETDYAERHAAFYTAIEEGASLGRIELLRDGMTRAARRGLVDILRVQGITLLLCLMLGDVFLRAFGLSTLHTPLFLIDALAVGLQVLLLAALSFLFYLDRRRTALRVVGLLFVSNLGLTMLSQHLGARFFGYGFALSMGLSGVYALVILSRAFKSLLRDTFMLQGVPL